MANVAKNVIKPKEAEQFRIVFLFTGQGDSTILAVPTGKGVDDYTYILVDSDLDKEKNEVNIPKMLKDLLGGDKLKVYINTHPHKDHTGGIKEIYEEIGIEEVWHSNHKAKGKSKVSDEELAYVLSKVGKTNEFLLKGTNSTNQLRDSKDSEVTHKVGLIDYQVFSPAEYVCDDIEGEKEEGRRRRIHEQCGVFKFTYKGKSILFTGDANKAAWQDHITHYYKNDLAADVVTASHHGSRTAFKTDENDENPFEKHLVYIGAETLVISAPTQKDSPHDHPHDDAMKIYKKYFDDDNIYHLAEEPGGDEPFCLVITIDKTGKLYPPTIDKALIAAYSDNDDSEKEEQKKKNTTSFVTSTAAAAKPYAK